jgi:hypothetical protein
VRIFRLNVFLVVLAGTMILAAADLPQNRPNATTTSGLPAKAAVLREAQEKLSFAGRPIHPLLVQKFLGDLADESPVVVAADVGAAAGSKDYSSDGIKVHEGWVRYDCSTNGQEEHLGYCRLGMLTNGAQVTTEAAR